jgi:hypothetical protein
LKGVVPENHPFQAREILIFFQIGLLSTGEETHVSLQGETSLLEAAASSTLFP